MKSLLFIAMLLAAACSGPGHRITVDGTVDTDVADDISDTVAGPDTEEPDTEEPDTEEPDTEEPDTEDPDTTDPANDTEEPDTVEDSDGQPDTVDTDNTEPDTEEPDTEEPDTEKPDTVDNEPEDSEEPGDEDAEQPDEYTDPVVRMHGNYGALCLEYEGKNHLECGGTVFKYFIEQAGRVYDPPVILNIDPSEIKQSFGLRAAIVFHMNDGTLRAWGSVDSTWSAMVPEDAYVIPGVYSRAWKVDRELMYLVRESDDELMEMGYGYRFRDQAEIRSSVPVYAGDPQAGSVWASIKGVFEAGDNCIRYQDYSACNRVNSYGNGGKLWDAEFISGEWYTVSRLSSVPNINNESYGTSRSINNNQCNFNTDTKTISCHGYCSLTKMKRSDPLNPVFKTMHGSWKVDGVSYEPGMMIPGSMPLKTSTPSTPRRQVFYTGSKIWAFIRGTWDHETGMSPAEEIAVPFSGITQGTEGYEWQYSGWLFLDPEGRVHRLSSIDMGWKKYKNIFKEEW